jgi:hypothetical protein
MKTLLAASLLILAAASLPASAQYGTGAPWCLQHKGYGWNGSAPECSYRTLAACKISAGGNQGYCINNPWLKKKHHR